MNWTIDIAGRVWRHGDYSLLCTDEMWSLMHTDSGNVCRVVRNRVRDLGSAPAASPHEIGRARRWAEGLMQ